METKEDIFDREWVRIFALHKAKEITGDEMMEKLHDLMTWYALKADEPKRAVAC